MVNLDSEKVPCDRRTAFSMTEKQNAQMLKRSTTLDSINENLHQPRSADPMVSGFTSAEQGIPRGDLIPREK
jgi:hypothetical protein